LLHTCLHSHMYACMCARLLARCRWHDVGGTVSVALARVRSRWHGGSRWHRKSGGTVALARIRSRWLSLVLAYSCSVSVARWLSVAHQLQFCWRPRRATENKDASKTAWQSRCLNLLAFSIWPDRVAIWSKVPTSIQASVGNLASRLAPQLRFPVSVKGWTDLGENRVLLDVSARRLIASL